jgi:protein-L-isoaspartate(D-aspartate) O-methyltransferase
LKDTYRHKGLRNELCETLKKKGIKDQSVIDAINSVPRHLFFEPEFESHAYEDKAFPIGSGQTISQPYTVAYQTELMQVKPGDKILEIGTGSGYQAAILNKMGADVYSVERIESLVESAHTLLSSLGISINQKHSDGTLGWNEHAPYDKIIVTAGAPSIPRPYINQLKVGGILIIPVGRTESDQRMVKVVKTSDTEIEKEVLFNFRFVPLIGELGWK